MTAWWHLQRLPAQLRKACAPSGHHRRLQVLRVRDLPCTERSACQPPQGLGAADVGGGVGGAVVGPLDVEQVNEGAAARIRERGDGPVAAMEGVGLGEGCQGAGRAKGSSGFGLQS